MVRFSAKRGKKNRKGGKNRPQYSKETIKWTRIGYWRTREREIIILKDGRLVLSNNLAERGIKTLVIGRKNYLFSASFKGAQSNATILSLVETAKANGLHPRKYLEYLLTHLPNQKNTPLEAYLPWAPKVQIKCSI